MKQSLTEIYKSKKLPNMLTKFSNTDDVIELMKLFSVVDVAKPDDYKLDLNVIQKISTEEKESMSAIVEFLIGLVVGKLGTETSDERKQIETAIESIVKRWSLFGSRVTRHALNIAKLRCDWLSNERIAELEELMDDVEADFYSDSEDSDEEYVD